MYVCICRNITDKQILTQVHKGAHCVREVNKKIGIPVQCGKCCCLMKQIIQESLNTLPVSKKIETNG